MRLACSLSVCVHARCSYVVSAPVVFVCSAFFRAHFPRERRIAGRLCAFKLLLGHPTPAAFVAPICTHIRLPGNVHAVYMHASNVALCGRVICESDDDGSDLVPVACCPLCKRISYCSRSVCTYTLKTRAAELRSRCGLRTSARLRISCVHGPVMVACCCVRAHMHAVHLPKCAARFFATICANLDVYDSRSCHRRCIACMRWVIFIPGDEAM